MSDGLKCDILMSDIPTMWYFTDVYVAEFCSCLGSHFRETNNVVESGGGGVCVTQFNLNTEGSHVGSQPFQCNGASVGTADPKA